MEGAHLRRSLALGCQQQINVPSGVVWGFEIGLVVRRLRFRRGCREVIVQRRLVRPRVSMILNVPGVDVGKRPLEERPKQEYHRDDLGNEAHKRGLSATDPTNVNRAACFEVPD
jgi:hypothetical protein